MKKIILFLTVLFTINANAEIIIDDFSTGDLPNAVYSVNGPTDLYQTGNMVGNNRMLKLRITAKRDNQNVQVAILQSKLVASFGYNTVGVLQVNYGSSQNGLIPMSLNFIDSCELECKSLNIEFDAKSSVSGLHVGLFTSSDRAVWHDHVTARQGIKRVTIPFTELNIIGENFTLEQVDYIRFQFDSRTKTGHNFAINRIWVE